MPRFVVKSEVDRGELKVLSQPDFGLRTRFGAAWLRGRSLHGAAERFLALMASGQTVQSKTRRRRG
jgi:DNA-binding transcriptional LysR family regulator